MRYLALVFCVCVAAPTVVQAKKVKKAKAGDQAEAQRLVEEINKLAKRNAWSGVNSSYAKLTKLKRVTFPASAHFVGAQASRAAGNVTNTLARVKKAKAAGHNAKACTEWINDINKNYGQVKILKQKKPNRALAAASAPFAPDRRGAIAFAATKVKSGKKFVGWLPTGAYKLGNGKTFSVLAGRTTTVKKK